MNAAAFCAACLAPLRDGLARPSDAGYVCTRRDCERTAHDLERIPLVTRPYAQGASVREICRDTNLGSGVVRRILANSGITMRPSPRQVAAQREAEVRFTGQWVRVGMVWKPKAA